MSVHNKGEHTYSVPMSMFKNNRSRVIVALKDQKEKISSNNAYIILKGGCEIGFYDTDVLVNTFRQVSYCYVIRNDKKRFHNCSFILGIILSILVWCNRT